MTGSGVSPAQWEALSRIVAGQVTESDIVDLAGAKSSAQIASPTIAALLRRGLIVQDGPAYVATKHGRQELRDHRERVAASMATSCPRKVRYRDETAAKLALAETRAAAAGSDRREKSVYRCPQCRGYHLTSG